MTYLKTQWQKLFTKNLHFVYTCFIIRKYFFKRRNTEPEDKGNRKRRSNSNNEFPKGSVGTCYFSDFQCLMNDLG